jgi:hypothetical protein
VTRKHRNYPIQALCAYLFNRSVLSCARALRLHGARILFTFYDSITVLTPTTAQEEVTKEIVWILKHEFQSPFPDARVRLKVKVNDQTPGYWNDGKNPRSLEDLIEKYRRK